MPAEESDALEPPAVIYETRRSLDEEEQPPPLIILDPRAKPGEPPPTEIGVRPATGRWRLQERDRWEPAWGASARLQMALGRSRGNDVEMGGFGLAFRYRPVPHLAFELGADALFGTDWHGQRRHEVIVGGSALVYFNPDSKLQLYLPLGLHGSGARVEVEEADRVTGKDYRYFGGHAGLGLEIQLSPAVALPIELLGFVRSRTDGAARRDPEFVDEKTHLVTNTSGGGLLRAGVVVYW